MITRRALVATGGSAAVLGAAAYTTWPRLGPYREEVERQRALLQADPSILELVRMATLASNGHNTQPWKFRLDSQQVSILPDFMRRTAVVDPDDHHLYVSLGCAAENLVIAAAAFGRLCDVQINAGKETDIRIETSPGPVGDDQLYRAIPARQSTRSIYDGKRLSKNELSRLEGASKMDGVSVQFFTDDLSLEAILEFVVDGNSAQMDDPAFIAELLDWIRFSPNQALVTKDGLFSVCSGNPVMPEWIGPYVFKTVFKKESENDKYRDHVLSSAGVAVFTGDRTDHASWIKVGRSFQRFALEATALGIRTAHINQPIEVKSLRREFSRWLGAPDANPDLVIRFGRAPILPHSLRRPVADVLI